EQFTTDGAQTWTERVLGEFSTQSPLQSAIVGDTLFLMGHHSENDQLWLAQRHVDDTVWQTQFLTASFRSGDVLASLVDRKGGDDEVHVVYDEAINDKLLYGIRRNGNWNIEEIPFVTEATASASIILDANGNPVIGFIPETNDEIRIFRKSGGNWSQESVSSGTRVDDVALVADASNEWVFFFDTDERGLALASKPTTGNTWTISLIDTTSAAVGDQPKPRLGADGSLHVAYVDLARSLVKYALRPPGGSWQLSEVTPAFEFNPATIDLALDTLGAPLIAYRDAFIDSIFLAERNGADWQLDQVEGEAADFTGIDLNLVISDLNSPWIAYNLLTSIGELRLVFRDPAGVWQPVSVLANNAQIAEPFDFHLVEKDFYIIGQKAQINNRGVGLLYANGGLSTLNEQKPLAAQWKAYPNPATEKVTLSWENIPSAPLKMTVYNVNGQSVYFYFEKIAKENGQVLLDTKDWVPGVYVLSIQSGNQIRSLKISVLP
ncbi:MAG: T9SS type A sorting domain-containing protein, partial [Bacteroidota bacterium]